MSASEKLKARLYPVLDRPKLTLAESAAIIAVVEAAETYVELDKRYQRRLATDHVIDALATLDEALGKEA